MPELMARGGMRVGEVLRLTAMDVDDQKLAIRNPKSGRITSGLDHPEAGHGLKDYLKDQESA